jgi:outer membrane protein assembly factor BamB
VEPGAGASGATVLGVDVGADGVPFLLASGAGGAALYPFDAASATWQAPLPLGGIDAQQVAVGDQTRIFVLDSSGNGYKYDAGGFTQVLTGVAHLTANHDGTVWHSDGSANAFRFISERAYPSQSLPVASAVQQVASTAYGNAMLLTNQGGAQQLYRYDSPYLFKTSPSFVPTANGTVGVNPQVAAGGGRCFVNLGSGIVALDNHTGMELWSSQLPNQGECQSIVYDPNHRLLFATDSTQTSLHWMPPPALSAGFSRRPTRRSASRRCRAAVSVSWATTSSIGLTPMPRWRKELPECGADLADNPQHDLDRKRRARSGPCADRHEYDLCHAQQQFQHAEQRPGGVVAEQRRQRRARSHIRPTCRGPLCPGDRQLDLERCAGSVRILKPRRLHDGIQHQPARCLWNFALPNNAAFAPGLTVYQNTLFAGGSDGNLYGLDLTQDLGNAPSFQPVAQLGPSNQTSFGAGPVTIHTSQGDVIAFSTASNNVGSIWLYLPPAPTPQPNGALVQLETDHLVATQMTMDANGILYATGSDPADNTFGQVYAIRIDTLLQQERAFIVDSELMQDFDEPVAGQLTATARYQTHVTVVDPNKAPQPFQAVKVWAETGDPNLLALVLIDGAPYYVNETTPAAVQTDAAGALTIVSDATDLSTPSLKLWAGFMNPYERIVIYPDRAFHNRLTTTHYDNSSTNPDPTRINLATATTYDVTNLTSPPTLFAASEQPQANAAAGAVQQMANAVGYPQGVTPGTARRGRAGAAASSSYLAYGDLAGAAYGSVNTPANRLVTALANPGFTGFAYDGAAFTVTPLSVADAANAIDALAGQTAAAPGSFWSRLRALWEKIKSGVATVAKIVVSIGRDIYLGLQYIENGIVQVLRQALRDIEDVAIAIGSVFVQLGKDIVKAAEALSVIFHLGAVLVTADMLKNVFTTMTSNLATFVPQAQAQLNSFFIDAETHIDNAFTTIITELDGATLSQLFARATTASIGGLQGMGATPHTIFAVAPQGAQPTPTQAAPAMWGMHKLRQKYGQATTPSVGAAPSNPLTTFVQGFFADPSNASQLSQFKTNYPNSGLNFSSAKEFFASLLAELLADLKNLVIDLLGLVQGLVDGMLDGIDYFAEVLGALGEVQIPILSTLWKALTGNPLTFLDVIAFVIAIPITLVYRIVEGAFPTAPSTRGATIDTAIWQHIEGLASVAVGLLSGIFTAILDAEGISSAWADSQPLVIDLIDMVSLALGQGFYLVVGDVLQPDFYVVTASVLQLILVALNAIPVIPPEAPSAMGVSFSPALLWLFYEVYKPQQTVETAKLGFAANVISTVATIVNPIKFAPAESLVPYVAPIADVACAFAAAGLNLGATIQGWDAPQIPTALPDGEEPAGAHRVFMPAILQGW